MNLQKQYDLEIARDMLSKKIDEEVELFQAS
jgi:plasmid maintenance system antidote protein VapI